MSRLDQVTDLCYTVCSDHQTVVARLEKSSLMLFTIQIQWQEQFFKKELTLEIPTMDRDIERVTSRLRNMPKDKASETAEPQKGLFRRLDWYEKGIHYSLLLLPEGPLPEPSIVMLFNEADDVFHIPFVQSYGFLKVGKSYEQSRNFEDAFKAFLTAIELLGESYITPNLEDDSDMKLMAIEENYEAGNQEDSCEAARRLLEGKLSLYCDKYHIQIRENS